MSRQKSVVLSPADKKALAAEVKGNIKTAKAALKELEDQQKALDKKFAADTKALIKPIAAATKALQALEAKHAELTAAPAEA